MVYVKIFPWRFLDEYDSNAIRANIALDMVSGMYDWRFGKRILVEGMGIQSAEFAMLCLYSIGLISYYFFQPTGKWILFTILVLWFTIQFFCHWYYTIFGASERKLKGYNACFKGTLRLIPMSEKRVIPDLYHTVLHILILLNGILCLLPRHPG